MAGERFTPGKVEVSRNADLRAALKTGQPLIFDGAMGTVLMQRGYENILAEKLNLEKPEVIAQIHKEYALAGADIVETNTFNASLLKLQELGLADKLAAINHAAVKLARASGAPFVAGSMGPTGKLLEPLGALTFDEAYQSYRAQAEALSAAGVDLFIIETISDIQEMRAALLAVKDVSDRPVICSLTYNEQGRTLTGTDMFTAGVTLRELGADVLSINCSIGPEGVVGLYKKYYKDLGELGLSLMVMPNAGMPELIDDKLTYTMTPARFAEIMAELAGYGVQIYGGCCGTTPAHIAALAQTIKTLSIKYHNSDRREVYFTSRNKVLRLSEAAPFLKIGESLNPTARKKFAEELKSGQENFLREQARAQSAADLLDLNVGVPELDQKQLMKKCIQTLTMITDKPLCLDSDDAEVLEIALKTYPGIALVNSVNGKPQSLEKIVPLAKRYGAALIALTLDERGIPAAAAERVAVAEKIMACLRAAGFAEHRVFFDGLVMTLASEPQAALETLQTTEALTKRGWHTSLGVSNVSFGLPQRKNINNVFLKLLEKASLKAAIVSAATYQRIDKYSEAEKLAEAVILGRDPGAKKYIESISARSAPPVTEDARPLPQGSGRFGLPAIYETIIEGNEAVILDLVISALQKNRPQEILDKELLPALEKVGEYYSAGKYYLPQMIASANTMKKAFEYLKPLMQRDGAAPTGTAIICTVEGDIHDIGKNIVAMMLENHGFQVVDLGKDVSADKIVEAVLEHKADIVLLSALLTTTMLKMKEVKAQLAAKGLNIPVMVGGAVVTPEFAANFGARYTADAAAAVQLAKNLIKP
ncbi:MAG: homocysteine S-methyltransferase family protein [Candidatus Margulisbacteria bacterium]|jgi:5-methyltetrahydrofolate--homocysteine methyltransferase|nr:homocysteine S-methyltransferase family protein [Candidatus Margulisiibacteriota bacterium]